MKWLLMLLLTINVVLFVVQIKDRDKESVVYVYSSVDGAKEIKLLIESRTGLIEDSARCVVIGEVSEQHSFDTLNKFLTDNEIKFDVIEKKEEMAPYYWVYVLDSSDQLADILKRKRIDSFVVGSGELKGAISLGIFENIDLAKDLIKDLKKQKIEAQLRERKKTKLSRWVSLNQDQLDKNSDILSELNAMKLNVGEIKEFFCKSIASEK